MSPLRRRRSGEAVRDAPAPAAPPVSPWSEAAPRPGAEAGEGARTTRARGLGRVDHVIDVRQWMWWLYVVFVVVGGVLVVRHAAPFVVAVPIGFVVGLIFFAGIALALLRILHAIDRVEVQPATTILSAFLWGMLAAPPLAYAGENAVQGFFGPVGLSAWGASLSAATVEETAKLVGVIALLYLTRARTIRPIDGLVYGAVVGIAFEVTENVEYILNGALTNPNSDLVGSITQAVGRVVFGFGDHAIFTGITGLGAAYLLAGPSRSRARRVAAFVACVALAWALHFLWDSPFAAGSQNPFALVPYYALAIVAFILAAKLARRTEHEWIREILGPLPDDIADDSDMDALASHRGYRHARRWASRHGHGRGRHAFRELEQGQIVLAGLLRTRSVDDAVVQRQLESVRELRAEAVEAGGVPAPGIGIEDRVPATATATA